MHSLKRLKNFLPTNLKKILVETLVIPHFDYCDVLLTDLNCGLTEKLQRVHNMCIRYIFNIRKYDHVSPSFQELTWLRLCDRRKMHSLILLFKILHTSIPSYLASRFHFLSSNHNLNTRSHHNLLLNIPQHKTSHYSTSYSVSTARYWNSLPQEIRGCRTLESFKRNLNLFLL